MKLTKGKMQEIIKEYLLLTAAAILLILGNYLFKFPNHYNFGGVTGISVLLSKVLPVKTGTTTFVMNMISLLVGFIFLGRSFGIKTVYVTALFSIGLKVMEFIFPMGEPLTNEPILELFFAILLPAIASAILINQNASSGGTDIIAMLLRKFLHMEVSRALLVADAIIVLLSYFLYGMKVGLFSTVGWLVKSIIAEYVLSDINLSKCMTIICDDAGPICDYIETELHKSATVYEAVGAHTHAGKQVVMTVMSPRKAQLLIEQLKVIQPTAFVMVTKSSEIHGKGYRKLIA